MKRSYVSVVAVLGAVATVLTACGSSGQSTRPVNTQPKSTPIPTRCVPPALL